MPYIDKDSRKVLDDHIDALLLFLHAPGEHNYVITRLIHGYITVHGLRYRTLNAAVGILECAKQEFLRTVVGPYEKIKAKENGSISLLDGEFHNSDI